MQQTKILVNIIKLDIVTTYIATNLSQKLTFSVIFNAQKTN